MSFTIGCVLKDEVDFPESLGLLSTCREELFSIISLSFNSSLREYVLAHELGHIIAPSLALVNNLHYFSDKSSANLLDGGYSLDEEKYLHRFSAKLTKTPLEILPEDFIEKYFR